MTIIPCLHLRVYRRSTSTKLQFTSCLLCVPTNYSPQLHITWIILLSCVACGDAMKRSHSPLLTTKRQSCVCHANNLIASMTFLRVCQRANPIPCSLWCTAINRVTIHHHSMTFFHWCRGPLLFADDHRVIHVQISILYSSTNYNYPLLVCCCAGSDDTQPRKDSLSIESAPIYPWRPALSPH